MTWGTDFSTRKICWGIRPAKTGRGFSGLYKQQLAASAAPSEVGRGGKTLFWVLGRFQSNHDVTRACFVCDSHLHMFLPTESNNAKECSWIHCPSMLWALRSVWSRYHGQRISFANFFQARKNGQGEKWDVRHHRLHCVLTQRSGCFTLQTTDWCFNCELSISHPGVYVSFIFRSWEWARLLISSVIMVPHFHHTLKCL